MSRARWVALPRVLAGVAAIVSLPIAASAEPSLRVLGTPARFDPVAESLASEHTVKISWAALESPELGGYRVTAVVRNGPMAGLVAEWTLKPEVHGAQGPFSYELRLPLAAGPAFEVSTTVEVLARNGRNLSQRRSSHWLRPAANRSLRSRAGFHAGAKAAGLAATQPRHASLAIPSASTAPQLPEARWSAPATAPALAAEPGRIRSRGPPARA